MKEMINKLIFRKTGVSPYEHRLCWPVNPDDRYLVVFVQWEQHEEWEVFPLRIELHSV